MRILTIVVLISVVAWGAGAKPHPPEFDPREPIKGGRFRIVSDGEGGIRYERGRFDFSGIGVNGRIYTWVPDEVGAIRTE